MATIPYTQGQIAEIASFLGTFTHDPVGFVWANYPWGEGELEGREPDEWQLKKLAEIRDGLKTPDEVIQGAVASGHGIGKSSIVCWIIQWAMATYEDCKGVVTANTQNQLLTKTWPELAKWHRLSLCNPMFEYTATSYYSKDKAHEKTWRIDALPWSEQNSEAFAGLHNQGKRILIIFDEASAISDVIWEVVEGALTDSNTEIIWECFGNPTRSSGRFFECFHKYRNFWKTQQIDSRKAKVANKKQLEKWISMYGIDSDIIRVRVLGQFPIGGDTQLIPYSLADKARENYKHLNKNSYEKQPVIIGCDPAWAGVDLLVIYLRQGNYSKVLFTCPKNDNDTLIAGKLALFEDEYNMAKGFIDQGYGTGIYSVLKSMGRGSTWELIPFNSSPNDNYYQNKRAEMWCLMRDWLKEGGGIEDKDEIINDLIAPSAFINTKGRYQLESKEDLPQSPNYADALALTFAQPVRLDKFSQYRAKMRKKNNVLRKAGRM